MLSRRRRDRVLGWPVLVSLVLHGALGLSLLLLPPEPPQVDASEEASWDVVAGAGAGVGGDASVC
jgi:hypothetical protein